MRESYRPRYRGYPVTRTVPNSDYLRDPWAASSPFRSDWRGSMTPDHRNETVAAEQRATPEPAAEPAPEPVVNELEAALKAARLEASDNHDKYLRTRAEMENYKRRIERQYTDLAKSHKKDLLLKILGVMDNLERALQFQATDAEGRDALATGIRLTHWQMQELLKSEGLKEIPTVGERFDPRLHEAVDTISGTPEQDGTIAAASEKGYQYLDDVLRPARVTVVTSEER